MSVPQSRLWSPVNEKKYMNYNITANANRDDVCGKGAPFPMIESSIFVDNFA